MTKVGALTVPVGVYGCATALSAPSAVLATSPEATPLNIGALTLPVSVNGVPVKVGALTVPDGTPPLTEVVTPEAAVGPIVAPALINFKYVAIV
mgnify:CR=1 FL=1